MVFMVASGGEIADDARAGASFTLRPRRDGALLFVPCILQARQSHMKNSEIAS
jgi:hypothetical protein